MNEALEKAREARRRMKEQGLKVEVLNPIEKAKANPKSLRLAINGKCWDCQSGDPGTRERIRDCWATDCSLHPVRPYQK